MALKYIVDIDLTGNELQNAALQVLATAPSTPSTGQVYYDSAQGGVYIYNGTAWNRVGLTADNTTTVEAGGVISVKSGVFAAASHTHAISEIVGLQTALNDKVDDSQVLTNVPSGAVFTDTTYSAGNGISLSGTTFSVAGGDGLTQEGNGLKVDATVVRTSGTQTIGGNKTFANNVIVEGNLNVLGTTTTIDSEVVLIKDSVITLSSNATSPAGVVTSGIEVNRGTGEEKPSIYWSESVGRWMQSYPGIADSPLLLEGEGTRTDEQIRDVIGAAISGSGATTVTVNDAANTIVVSSTDTNTTYSAGTGISLSGTTFHVNSISVPIQAAAWGGGTFNIDLPGNGLAPAIGSPITVQVYEIAGSAKRLVMTDIVIDENTGILSVELPAGDFVIAMQGYAA